MKKGSVIVRVSALLLAVLMMTVLCSCMNNYQGENTVKTPLSSREAKGRNYEDVVTKFSAAGFENVYAEPMGDLIVGIINKYGEVEEVDVGGKTDFGRERKCSPDTYVIVRYHSFTKSSESITSDDDESTQPVIADTSDGMCELPISSDDIVKLTVREAEELLSEAGFVNIKREPLRDLMLEVLHSYGDIKEVSVGGDIEFSEGVRMPPDVRIVIRYHSY